MKFNKKGFELSATMLVVIILGIVILIAGLNIFFSAYDKTIELKESVDTQTQRQLESLLDDGGLVVVPVTSKVGERGDVVDFNLGVNNERGQDEKFTIQVEYLDGTGNDVFKVNCEWGQCGPLWNKNEFTLKNNEQKYVPIRIIIPKKTSKGQYVFYLDVMYKEEASGSYEKYGARQLLTVNIQ